MGSRVRGVLGAALLGAVAGYAGQAGAAGFAIIEHSAQGMGNAFAGGGAVAEDASTVWFNPASITLRPNELQAAGHLILPSFEYQHQSATAGTGAPIQGNTVQDGGTNAVVPNLYYIRKLTDTVTFGLGVNAPFGLATEYDRDWVGRYQAVESEIITIHVNPTIAVKLTDKLSVGAGFNVQYFDAKLSSAVDFRTICLGVAASPLTPPATAAALGAACTGPANTALDGFAENKADDVSVGFNAGLMYEFSERTRVGVAYREKIEHDLDGKVTFSVPTALAGALGPSFPSGGVSANVRLPDSLSFSGYHRFHDKFAMMADATWTGWSSVPRLVIRYDTVTPLRDPTAIEELGWSDAWRLGVGFNYYHNKKLTLRAGFAYDESPAGSPLTATARLPDADRKWLSVGASYAFTDRMQADFGYSHLFVSDSRIQRTGPANNVLIGGYEADADIISLQFNYKFD